MRSVIAATFNVHSIFCWHSSSSVRVVAAGHSFPSSPLGFLKEYPSDRMNLEAVLNAKCLQVRVQEFCQHSCVTARGTRCLPGPGQVRAPRSAGGQERNWESLARSTCGVSKCACSKNESAFFCEAETLRHGPLGLDEGEGAEPLLHVLRHFVQGSAGSSSPAPSPAAAGSSPAGSVATLAMSSCTATCSATSLPFSVHLLISTEDVGVTSQSLRNDLELSPRLTFSFLIL